jgi:hypothetical protein
MRRRQTGHSVSKLEPSAEFAGAKSIFISPRGSSSAHPVFMAELIVDDLRAIYGISAGTAFVVLLYLCGPKAIG